MGGLASGVHHKGMALLGYYAVLIGNWLATFWESLSVPFASVKQSNHEYGTNMLSQYAGN